MKPASQSDILVQQLGFIISKLYELYPQNESVHYNLKNASELLKASDIEHAADTLHKVMNNPELIVINRLFHDNIVEEARNYGKYVEVNWEQIKASLYKEQLTKDSDYAKPHSINNEEADYFDLKPEVPFIDFKRGDHHMNHKFDDKS